jgi:DNA-binding MarR family transcriptional regulator
MLDCCIRNKTELVFVAYATIIFRMSKKTLGEAPLAAWKSLLNAHAVAVGAIEARLREADEIPLTWYDVLWALRKAGGDCCLRFRQLQDEIVLSRSALSRLVDALEKAGLVKKQTCAKDARGLDVELTEKGHKALASAWPIYSEGIIEHFARHLTAEECQQVAKILAKVGELTPTCRNA